MTDPLHPAAKPCGGMLDVVVVLLHGGYASTAVGPIEVFHSAGLLWNALSGESARPRFRVRVASIDGAPVASEGGLGLVPNCAIAEIAHADIVILAATGLAIDAQIAAHAALLPWMAAWHARGAYVAGICTGVALLAESGILDGRQATTHWAVAEELARRYPGVCWRPEQFVTDDGRVLCAGGVYAAIDLSLYLVEKFCGHELALKTAKALLVSMPRSRQSGYAVLPLSPPHSDAKIRQAEEYLRDHYHREISIDALAARIGMGPRNFARRFKAATGRLPRSYIQLLRIAAAKELLERGEGSIQTVCSKIGYDDLAFFRSVFKRHTGMNPADYRRAFAGMNLERGAVERPHPDPGGPGAPVPGQATARQAQMEVSAR